MTLQLLILTLNLTKFFDQDTDLNPFFRPMVWTTGLETDDIDCSTETESLIENTPTRKSDNEIEKSSSVSVTSDEVSPEFISVTDCSCNN